MKHARVTQLQEMLLIRRSTQQVFVERPELVAAVQACRNYNDYCCICSVEYQTGDPLRVLPKCRHEFHMECLDKWAYSFADKQQQRREPTCPLCKGTLL